MKEWTWREVVKAMQRGAHVEGKLDKTKPGCPVVWRLDGEIINEWRYGMPPNTVRTRPGGPDEPFVAYLTDNGKAYRDGQEVRTTSQDVAASLRIVDVGLNVPEEIRALRDGLILAGEATD